MSSKTKVLPKQITDELIRLNLVHWTTSIARLLQRFEGTEQHIANPEDHPEAQVIHYLKNCATRPTDLAFTKALASLNFVNYEFSIFNTYTQEIETWDASRENFSQFIARGIDLDQTETPNPRLADFLWHNRMFEANYGY